MAHLQDDFVAYTTIGERVAPPTEQRKPVHASSAGPSFTVPPKLEPFLLLAKSARGAGAANLITQATSAAGVYVFSELLEQQSIKDERSIATDEKHAGQYRLLELFAYGTWGEYLAAKDSYPALTTEQEAKLKHLSVLSLATQNKVIPYSILLSTLSLSGVPELEDLLIELFYANVLTGRLDQKGSRLEVLTSVGRDVRPAPASSAADEADEASMQVDSSASTLTSIASAPSIATLTASLTGWLETISSLLSSLDKHIAALQASAINASQEQLEHEKRVRAVAEEVAASAGKTEKGKGGGAGSDGGEASAWKSPSNVGDMDVDSSLPGGFFGGEGGSGMRGLPPLSPGGGFGGGGGNSGGRTRKRGRM
ncbi:COP9 signalosome complex subunit 7 [Rhodotorula toruloides]|uniref:COP9 signalosome complex subunit 7 n=1 Tax=Rhodotorula toruloides TaxID=5286 RepID=A0A511KJ59_RHOTO|nr:COP9 signalosome complex subunit 7 [Rhodotorula toruloides]